MKTNNQTEGSPCVHVELLTHSEVFDVGRDGVPLDHSVRSQVLLRDGAPQLPAQVRRYLALVERTLALSI